MNKKIEMEMEKDLMKFSIRKRMNKYSIVYLDHYVSNDIKFNKREYV